MLGRIQPHVGRLLRQWWGLLPQPVRRLIKLGAGVFFLVLGVIGIFIPVMPQVAFFLISLTILSSESPRARNLLRRTKRWVARKRRALRRRKKYD